MIESRLIKPDEWPRIAPIFEQEKGKMPCLDASRAAILEKGSEIIGFWAVQLVPHAGPLWIREDHRGQGLWRDLHKALEGVFTREPGTGYFSFHDPEQMNMRTILTQLGYTALPYLVWKKEF